MLPYKTSFTQRDMSYEYVVEIPGISPEKINVSVERFDSTTRYLYVHVGSEKHIVTCLTNEYDENSIYCTLTLGVLKIVIEDPYKVKKFIPILAI